MPRGGPRPGSGRPRKPPPPPKPPRPKDVREPISMKVPPAWLASLRESAAAAGETLTDYVLRSVEERRARSTSTGTAG
jgi:hypothetical protein